MTTNLNLVRLETARVKLWVIAFITDFPRQILTGFWFVLFGFVFVCFVCLPVCLFVVFTNLCLSLKIH